MRRRAHQAVSPYVGRSSKDVVEEPLHHIKLGSGFPLPPERHKRHPELVVRAGVARIQHDGSAKFLMGSFGLSQAQQRCAEIEMCRLGIGSRRREWHRRRCEGRAFRMQQHFAEFLFGRAVLHKINMASPAYQTGPGHILVAGGVAPDNTACEADRLVRIAVVERQRGAVWADFPHYGVRRFQPDIIDVIGRG